MAWVKIDCDLPNHPDFVAVGPLGEIFFVRCLLYCHKYLTDGFIPLPLPQTITIGFFEEDSNVSRRYGRCMTLVSKLYERGIFEYCEGGICVPFEKYSQWQQTREEVHEIRSNNAKRQAILRERRKESNADVTALRNADVTAYKNKNKNKIRERDIQNISHCSKIDDNNQSLETHYQEGVLAFYPERAGQRHEQAGLRAYAALIASGHSHEELSNAVKTYAAFCFHSGQTGTQFVMCIDNFFTGDTWNPKNYKLTPKRSPPNCRETVEEAYKRLSDEETKSPLLGQLPAGER